MTLSFHKHGEYFPGTGDVRDTGSGAGEGYAVNFPLRDGIDDAACPVARVGRSHTPAARGAPTLLEGESHSAPRRASRAEYQRTRRARKSRSPSRAGLVRSGFQAGGW